MKLSSSPPGGTLRIVPAPGPPLPLRVLLVEDRPSDAALLVHELGQAGFAPEWKRVETRSEYLAQLDPTLDVILADYTLPQFSGLEALRLLKERGLAIPFILITGNVGEDAAVSAMHQGADDYLLKDRLARLGGAVTHALEQRALREEKQRAEQELRDSEQRLLNQERAARAEAEAAVRMRDEFVAIASHELRTPVTAIKATAQLLLSRFERGDVEPARVIGSLRTVNMMSDQLSVLIADLLDVSRLRTGRLQIRPERLDLAALARRVVEEHHAQLGAEYPLTLRVFGGLPLLNADPHRMQQVLSNLVQNAIKYSPAGGEIELSLRGEDLGVLITVSDRGIGLPPEAAESIFEPFGRASNAQRQHMPGMGLGLYIARQIVEQHGGRIWADSAGEGHGTQLHLWLPGIAQQVPAPRRGRVLVVDDETSIRETLGDALEQEGYDCRLAANGRDALDVLSDWGPDLIVLDLMMPVMDGWSFRREQQARPAIREIPIVVISAAGRTRDGQEAELAPAAILDKPFELDELITTIQQHILGGDSRLPRAA